jgi:hypothetical protein
MKRSELPTKPSELRVRAKPGPKPSRLPKRQRVKVRCEAKNRQGQQCGHEAGWGTNHLGAGKCRLHGGATPIKSGRYSKLKYAPYAELTEQFSKDPERLNLLPELDLTRAMLWDFIERYGEWRDAFLDWHRSFAPNVDAHHEAVAMYRTAIESGDPAQIEAGLDRLKKLAAPAAKPRMVLDITDARNTVLAIARIVETIDKMRKTVTINDVMRIMETVGRVVKVEIDQLNVQVINAVPDELREQVKAMVAERVSAIEAGWQREVPLIAKT